MTDFSYDTVPATNFPLFVETATDVWVEVDGVSQGTRTNSKKSQETSRFSRPDFIVQDNFANGITFSYSGFAVFSDAGVKDPGQAKCEDYSNENGRLNVGHFRIHNLHQGTAADFYANVLTTEHGGQWGQASTWKVDLTVRDWPTVVDLDGS
jgi:hypothetical protein